MLGIDLGSLETRACVWQNDDHRGDLGDRTNTLSSIFYDDAMGFRIDSGAKEAAAAKANTKMTSRLLRQVSSFTASDGLSALLKGSIVPLDREFDGFGSFEGEWEDVEKRMQHILEAVVKATREQFGDAVSCDKAVIAIPGCETWVRHAIVEAASKAKLHILRLAHSPIMAAFGMWYKSLTNVGEDENALVLDIGFGSTDVAILEMFGDTDSVDILALKVKSNFKLGVSNIIGTMLDDLMEDFPELSPNDVMEGCHGLFQEFTHPKVTSSLDDYVVKTQIKNVVITKHHRWFQRFVQEFLDELKSFLGEVSMNYHDLIDKVLLPGGVMHMDGLEDVIKERFGTQIQFIRNDGRIPVVAIGSALHASILSGENKEFQGMVMDSVAQDISLKIETFSPGNDNYSSNFVPVTGVKSIPFGGVISFSIPAEKLIQSDKVVVSAWEDEERKIVEMHLSDEALEFMESANGDLAVKCEIDCDFSLSLTSFVWTSSSDEASKDSSPSTGGGQYVLGNISDVEYHKNVARSGKPSNRRPSAQPGSTIILNIVAAEGLAKADRFGLSDPYCVIKFNGLLIGKTDIIKKSLNPRWDHRVYLRLPETLSERDRLVLDVYDHDLLSSDDFLGRLVLTGDEIGSHTNEKAYPLTYRDDWPERKQKFVQGKLIIAFQNAGIPSLRDPQEIDAAINSIDPKSRRWRVLSGNVPLNKGSSDDVETQDSLKALLSETGGGKNDELVSDKSNGNDGEDDQSERWSESDASNVSADVKPLQAKANPPKIKVIRVAPHIELYGTAVNLQREYGNDSGQQKLIENARTCLQKFEDKLVRTLDGLRASGKKESEKAEEMDAIRRVTETFVAWVQDNLLDTVNDKALIPERKELNKVSVGHILGLVQDDQTRSTAKSATEKVSSEVARELGEFGDQVLETLRKDFKRKEDQTVILDRIDKACQSFEGKLLDMVTVRRFSEEERNEVMMVTIEFSKHIEDEFLPHITKNSLMRRKMRLAQVFIPCIKLRILNQDGSTSIDVDVLNSVEAKAKQDLKSGAKDLQEIALEFEDVLTRILRIHNGFDRITDFEMKGLEKVVEDFVSWSRSQEVDPSIDPILARIRGHLDGSSAENLRQDLYQVAVEWQRRLSSVDQSDEATMVDFCEHAMKDFDMKLAEHLSSRGGSRHLSPGELAAVRVVTSNFVAWLQEKVIDRISKPNLVPKRREMNKKTVPGVLKRLGSTTDF